MDVGARTDEHWIEALTCAQGIEALTVRRAPQKRQVSRPAELWRAEVPRRWLWPSGERATGGASSY